MGGKSGDPTCAVKYLDPALASLALFLRRWWGGGGGTSLAMQFSINA